MIIVTGSVAYDYIMGFPGAFDDHILPHQTHNLNISFIVDRYAKHRGGTAGNASYVMGLLGIPHKLFTSAGGDFEEYKSAFKKLSIDTNHIQIDKDKYTATGFAMTDQENNQIWGYYYGAASGNKDLKLKKIAKPGDLVLIGPQGADGSMSFVRQCISLGIDYMFDPGFILTEASPQDLSLGIAHAKYVIGNDYEVQLMKKRVKNFRDIIKNRTLITTLGEKGAQIDSKSASLKIQALKVDHIISTTGAGDAWRGGFLAGLHKQFDLKICGRIGATASSYALESLGTQDYTFTKEEFVKRYRKEFGSEVEL